MTHCKKTMLKGVGADINKAAVNGMLTGINAETRLGQEIGYSVSGFMQDAKTVFLCLNFSICSELSVRLPFTSACDAVAFASSLKAFIVL